MLTNNWCLKKTTHPVSSLPRNKVVGTLNDGSESYLINEHYHTGEQKTDTVSMSEDYLAQGVSSNYLFPTPHVYNAACYDNRPQNCVGLPTDMKATSSTSHDALSVGYRPSSSMDPAFDDAIHKPGNGINPLQSRSFVTDWNTRRQISSQKLGSTRDRLPMLAENSNAQLNTDRYQNYANSINRQERLGHDRKLSVNLISSSSSFVQSNT
ncbi:unnamed protein product [Trichobilharzia regenti]|nr:unnamed protein product [Trichobilharzia regenti]